MSDPDLILGIETSCDDTSVSLVDRQGSVFACETVSQYAIHAEYGGVYPELASRAHLQAILPTTQKVLDVIGRDLSRVAAIGVTRGPGLIGSLLVGVNTAQALGASWNKAVYGVNHLRGHLRSPDLDKRKVEYPAVLLLVSGGHTLIAHMKTGLDIRLLGTTRDDSVGETYDKVARMLDLGAPGGPAVDRAASSGVAAYGFPRPMLREGYEFSFSGLKSSVARLVGRDRGLKLEDVAASFVAACIDVLEWKTRRAVEEFKPKSLVVVGGVAASPQVREFVEKTCARYGVLSCLPPREWATDNAAMIALATWDYVAQGVRPDLRANPNLPLGDW